MKQKETLKKVLSYIRNYWFQMMLSIVFAFITVALTLYVPILIGEAIDYIIGPEQVNFVAMNEKFGGYEFYLTGAWDVSKIFIKAQQ